MTAVATEAPRKRVAAKKTAASQASETPAEEPKPDIEVILPESGTVTIHGAEGQEIPAGVRRLKSREFLLLMRVITQGLGQGLTTVRLDLTDPDEAQGQMLGILMLAVPEALEEFGDFLHAIVEPKAQKDAASLAHVARNLDPGDLLDVLGVMVEQEKDDFMALMGKAQAWLARLQKTMSQTHSG